MRTEAVRLRARLTKYYATEGRRDDVIIDLPKGGYVPRFRHPEAVPENSRLMRVRRALALSRRRSVVILLAGLALAIAGVGWWRVQDKRAPLVIAVLPLENVSHDPANDYFADGLTDELIRNLAIIDDLVVRSRTSSFGFRGRPKDVREAGTQMQADYILEGSVLRLSRQLRINVQLIRVRDDFPLWSGRFEPELNDILAIQDEISRNIVNSLRLKLGRGRRRYETSAEAYDLYLRARYLDNQRGDARFFKSIPVYEQAIAKDPSFAPAYAALSIVYAERSTQSTTLDHVEEMARMRTAADKAIQLDPMLAEAHDALGLAYAREGQWEQSEKSFHHAIDLEPRTSIWYGHLALYYLMGLGRIDEALQVLRQAEKFDPVSPEIQFDLAWALISASRFDEAAIHCEKLPAEYPPKNRTVARAKLGQGKVAEAIELLATSSNSLDQAFLGYAYARAGRREEAEKLAAAATPLHQALILAGLGDKSRTLEALERMAPLGPYRLGSTLTFPELALVQGDSRLRALRKKVGLPD